MKIKKMFIISGFAGWLVFMLLYVLPSYTFEEAIIQGFYGTIVMFSLLNVYYFIFHRKKYLRSLNK